MDLAPDAPFRSAVLAGVSLPFSLDLDAGAVDQEMQPAGGSAIRDVDLQGLLTAAEGAEVWHRPVEVDQMQQALYKPRGLPEPNPNSTFIVRQVWIAASLQSGCRPRLSVGAASQIMARSNQIVSEPQRFSAALQAGQFLVLRRQV